MITIERMARAMAERRVPGSTEQGGQYFTSEGWRAVLLMDASAALQALRQVDDETVEAMRFHFRPGTQLSAMKSAFTAAIDHILSQTPNQGSER